MHPKIIIFIHLKVPVICLQNKFHSQTIKTEKNGQKALKKSSFDLFLIIKD